MDEKQGCLRCKNLMDGAFCAVYGKRIPFVEFGSSCVWFDEGDCHINPLRSVTCKYCGEIEHPLLGAGKGPHAASLNCRSCGRFITWMKKADFEFYQKLVEALQ